MKRTIFSKGWKWSDHRFPVSGTSPLQKALAALVMTSLLFLQSGCSAPVQEILVRPPAVAGSFYPADPRELSQMIESMLNAATPPKLEGSIRCLVLPHAGYIYSGAVAAYGFKALAGQDVRTVVVIGNSHHQAYFGAAVLAKGSFRTPLGDVQIDTALANKLMAADNRIFEQTSPHGPEHSLEVEVPFLQKTLKKFKIVPILLGTASGEMASVLGQALAANADEHTVVIASTDMSHYPRYEDANACDGKVAEAISSGNVETLERTIRQLETTSVPNTATFLCGEGAVKTVMHVAARIGADKIRLLKYANSGDTAGDKNRVVGYSTIAFSSTTPPTTTGENELTREEQQELLKIARQAVETAVKEQRKLTWDNKTAALNAKRGAFVTLKKRGELRGCIGRFEPDIPLYQVVTEMGIAAALQDHRFPPVAADELKDLSYEISVLSPLRKVASWKEIQIGKHGVEVVRGFSRGVFLPQVATEMNWDLETFMNNLCAHKAGLPADAWKDPKTDILVFTAQVFHE